MRFSGPAGRATTTAAVATSRDRRTKKCEAWKPSSCASRVRLPPFGGASVKVSELIVEACLQPGVAAASERHRRSGGVSLVRPAHRDETNHARGREARDVGKRPRQAIEALIARRREHVF